MIRSLLPAAQDGAVCSVVPSLRVPLLSALTTKPSTLPPLSASSAMAARSEKEIARG